MEAKVKEKYYGRLVPVNQAEATDPTVNYFPAVIVKKTADPMSALWSDYQIKGGQLTQPAVLLSTLYKSRSNVHVG